MLPGLGAVLLGLCCGCTMMGITRMHQVAVDAITGGAGIGGTSYQLVAKNARESSMHSRALACVQAALANKGMFEAPPKTTPDIYIQVDYGLGNSIPSLDGPPAVEKYLQLSARKNIENPATGVKSEELWNVRVTVAEPNSNVDSNLPLLAAVAADYAGIDTQSETVIMVADNSPTVARIKSVASGAGEYP
jgi:hypothetical protein